MAHTNALNQTTTYAYNAAADLIGVTAADGTSVEFERDAQGQLITYQYADRAQPLVQRFQYDTAGRLTQLTNENGEPEDSPFCPVRHPQAGRCQIRIGGSGGSCYLDQPDVMVAASQEVGWGLPIGGKLHMPRSDRLPGA